jgi:chemotaxis protein methyltransferase CheR
MVKEFHLSAEDFGRVRQLISTYAGIWLNDRKHDLVLNRLSGRLRATRVRTFGEYLDGVEAPGSPERECFVNALTTNVTAFFREQHHFAKLAERVRAVPRRGAPVKVWSCACSTGEEPYSAAMVLREAGCAGEILATDVNTEALAAARRAIYALEAVESLGEERLRRHFFMRGAREGGTAALVRNEVRAMVRFEQRNLLDPEWRPAERFDFVFCRNVMIYFDRAGQRRLLDRLAAVIAPHGMLFLGHAEASALGHPSFVPCGKTAYLRCGPNP